jgi:hypothetical protein
MGQRSRNLQETRKGMFAMSTDIRDWVSMHKYPQGENPPTNCLFDLCVHRQVGESEATYYRIVDCYFDIDSGNIYLNDKTTEDNFPVNVMDLITDDDWISHWSVWVAPNLSPHMSHKNQHPVKDFIGYEFQNQFYKRLLKQ